MEPYWKPLPKPDTTIIPKILTQENCRIASRPARSAGYALPVRTYHAKPASHPNEKQAFSKKRNPKKYELLADHNALPAKIFEDIVALHMTFECTHLFQDGNGRIGLLILFKECLKHNVVPFIIKDNLKLFYYRDLKEWDQVKCFLMDTCLTAQDRFKAYLDYFRIAY